MSEIRESAVRVSGRMLRVYTLNTVVVGSGAAGFSAAGRLYQYGQRDIAIVTEGINAGTSRNTGSDKQTYYKLTLSGGDPDSVREMAETLFSGGCVDGDIALCEAALSAESFLRLAELGVPFPKNRWGEYIGYKTDHDPRRRATSVGPYTSKRMTECLQAFAEEKGIRIFDRMQVIRILARRNTLHGLLCLDLDAPPDGERFVIFHCKNVVYATGGPAGLYADSVYPHGHYGASGIVFEAGVAGRNLTEWQYGLASVKPRWNVSGTYMQALPRFLSTAPDGSDEREFLADFFTDQGKLLDMVFLKGYQWPFDVRRVKDGSSIIDILVYLETRKGRRVFLDYRKNPGGGSVDFGSLSPEARDYLARAGACFGTPLERLSHMNAPAVQFYRERGADLANEPLEIALCAQHNNGGLAVDAWWQTNLEGFFAAGEAAATHGVYRPGGSALNAGQVGSTRAASYIAAKRAGEPETDLTRVVPAVEDALSLAEAVVTDTQNETCRALWQDAAREMSLYGGPIRNTDGVRRALDRTKAALIGFRESVRVREEHLAEAFRLWDMLLCRRVYLEAMLDYAAHGGKSRGSALYTDEAGEKPYPELPDAFRYTLERERPKHLQEVCLQDGECVFSWREARPIPQDDDFFENVWRDYREHGNVF